MNSTTGADATALSMAARVWSESRRAWKGVRGEMGARKREAEERTAAGRAACRRRDLSKRLVNRSESGAKPEETYRGDRSREHVGSCDGKVVRGGGLAAQKLIRGRMVEELD